MESLGKVRREGESEVAGGEGSEIGIQVWVLSLAGKKERRGWW